MVRINDDISAIVVGIRIRCISTTLNIEPNRQLGARVGIRWCEDVDEQAIFGPATRHGLAYSNTDWSELAYAQCIVLYKSYKLLMAEAS